MPKNHEILKRTFADFDEGKFLSVDDQLGLPVTPELSLLKERYRLLLQKNQRDITAMAQCEEIIIQMRAKCVVDSELRLSLSRNYIYARTLFYRKGTQINDIRVIAAKTTDLNPQGHKYGTNIGKLLKNPEFRELCKTKLLQAMDNEITANLQQLVTYDETVRGV